MLWITVERPNAFNDIASVQIEGLATDNDLLSEEFWAGRRKLLINEIVQFLCSLEAQVEAITNLETSDDIHD